MTVQRQHLDQNSSCALCTEFREPYSHILNIALGLQNFNRIIVPAGAIHFRLLPDMSPLVTGHTLICPEAHVLSFNMIPVDIHSEYLQLTAALATCFNNSEDICFLEHGGFSVMRSCQCIDHAHVHCIPCGKDQIRRTVAWLDAAANTRKVIDCVRPRGNYLHEIRSVSGSEGYVSIHYFEGNTLHMKGYYLMDYPPQMLRYAFASLANISPHILDDQERRDTIMATFHQLRTLETDESVGDSSVVAPSIFQSSGSI